MLDSDPQSSCPIISPSAPALRRIPQSFTAHLLLSRQTGVRRNENFSIWQMQPAVHSCGSPHLLQSLLWGQETGRSFRTLGISQPLSVFLSVSLSLSLSLSFACANLTTWGFFSLHLSPGKLLFRLQNPAQVSPLL